MPQGPESQRLSAQQAAKPRPVLEWSANLDSLSHRPPLPGNAQELMSLCILDRFPCVKAFGVESRDAVVSHREAG